MPRYDWKCKNGHVQEMFTAFEHRDDERRCSACGEVTERQFPKPHCPPSGVYSYEPNIGHPEAFERRREAIKAGQKVIPKWQPRNCDSE